MHTTHIVLLVLAAAQVVFGLTLKMGPRTDYAFPFQVDTRQGGALALMGEPFDADQAKFVPASAQDFNSTQVMIEHEGLSEDKVHYEVMT